MPRLINADALQTSIALYAAENAYINDTALDVLEMVSKWIDEAPTIEAEPVRQDCVEAQVQRVPALFRKDGAATRRENGRKYMRYLKKWCRFVEKQTYNLCIIEYILLGFTIVEFCFAPHRFIAWVLITWSILYISTSLICELFGFYDEEG